MSIFLLKTALVLDLNEFSLKDWDKYKLANSGKYFYYNPTDGLSSWKPPRSASLESTGSRKRRSLPRTKNSVYAYDSIEDHNNNSNDDNRVSIVRDSIR
jgi:hypothetical protein